MTQHILVINIKNKKFGDMFRFIDQSSDQNRSTGTISECVHTHWMYQYMFCHRRNKFAIFVC